MTVSETSEIADVLNRVKSWPAVTRITLARQILESVEKAAGAEPAPELPRGPSAADVMAMFKTDKPAPDDATVRQWIDDYRLEKYGK
jgi:hypothetical protein